MKKKLLCLGDSNTYGYDPRSCLGGCYPAAWPEILAELTDCDTINLGMNGREIPHDPFSFEIADALIRRQLPADLLLLFLGTNDLLNTLADAARLAEMRMDACLSHLKAVFPDLPLLLLTPMKYRTDGSWPALSEYPSELPILFQKLGEKHGIPVVDCTTFDLPLTFDGVHLTEEGHRLLAQKLAGILNAKTS